MSQLGIERDSLKDKEFKLKSTPVMSSNPFEVPETVTFEHAIILTQDLLSQVEAGGLSQPEVAALSLS